MFRVLLIVFALMPAQAALIDRLVISVGQQVITEQQLDEELRITALLNREAISRTADSRRRAADHLVQQLLVKREMQLSHYPVPDDKDVDQYFAEVRGTFGSPALFTQALAQYELPEATLKEHLALQLTTLRFIEFRFRPDMALSSSEIEAAYQRELAKWKADHPGAIPPSFALSQESIQKSLLEQRTDEMLSTWLEDTRKQVSIVYLDATLR